MISRADGEIFRSFDILCNLFLFPLLVAAEGGKASDNGFPMFQTRSGKSLIVRQSSVMKAAAVLGEDVDIGKVFYFCLLNKGN